MGSCGASYGQLSTVAKSVFRDVRPGPTIEVMTQISRIELASLARAVPDGVVRSSELRAGGLSGSAIIVRCRPGGPWQRLLPGVLLLSTAEPSRRQRLRAALEYAGEGAAITGVDAATLDHDLGVDTGEDVHVLVPAARRAVTKRMCCVAVDAHVSERDIARDDRAACRDGVRFDPIGTDITGE